MAERVGPVRDPGRPRERLDDMGITFMTLRRRSPALLKEIALMPRSAWQPRDPARPPRRLAAG